MKPRILALALLITVIGAGVWTWRHRNAKPSDQQVETDSTTPRSTPPPAITVISRRAPDQAATPGVAPEKPDPALVEVIVNPEEAYEKRAKAIAALTTNLSVADWTRLRSFLDRRDSSDEGQLGQVLKNQLMDVLCAFNPPPTELGDALIQIYRDRTQNGVIRDYALQHLAAYYEQLEIAHQSDPQARSQIQKALWDALAETGESIAGTALLGLQRLSTSRPAEFDRTRIATTAMKLASDPAGSELTRISALQVCGQMQTTEALPLAVSAAQSGETLSVKISAIGVLGMLGGSETKPLLTNFVNGSERRLRLPAQAALQQIARREEQAAKTNQKKG